MVAPSYPQPYPMMYPQPQVQGTPGLAVAALVCGLLGWIPLWIGFILCLLAITFGSIVLAQTKSGHPGRGLAITGLVFGLVLLLPAACGL
jgi:amino acid transporter